VRVVYLREGYRQEFEMRNFINSREVQGIGADSYAGVYAGTLADSIDEEDTDLTLGDVREHLVDLWNTIDGIQKVGEITAVLFFK
jgi:hypothetical protein